MPPMMTITKASMMTVAAMPIRGGHQRRRQHAAECGKPAADAEHARANELHVDAERVRHVGVLRGGADQQPEPRALEELPDRHGDHDAGAGQEQAIDRKRLVEQEDDAGEKRRGGDLQRVGPPDQPDGLADDQGQAEGHHQEGVGIAPVEAAQDAEFERRAERPDDQRRQRQRQPVSCRPATSE